MADVLAVKREQIMKVRSGSSTVGLSHVLANYLDDKIVLMQAVGAGAVNQAVKAIGSVTLNCARRGISVACTVGLEDGIDYRSDREITRVTFRVEAS